MIVEPKVKGFICITAHPVGCRESVRRQIAYVKGKKLEGAKGPKKVLVIGSSTGYGLASRITAAFGYGAATLGIMFERPATEKRTATPGFYNTRAFEELAHAEGRTEGITEGILSSIMNLMETMGISVEKAMMALKIPEAEQQKYLDLLQKQ